MSRYTNITLTVAGRTFEFDSGSRAMAESLGLSKGESVTHRGIAAMDLMREAYYLEFIGLSNFVIVAQLMLMGIKEAESWASSGAEAGKDFHECYEEAFNHEMSVKVEYVG